MNMQLHRENAPRLPSREPTTPFSLAAEASNGVIFMWVPVPRS